MPVYPGASANDNDQYALEAQPEQVAGAAPSLGKAAVLAYRSACLLAAESDEHQQSRTPGALGCELAIQTRRELLTGIIGARRAWTVSMISVLSMPWR
jgi:hypothetical protein